jgi:hypothetical protein
MIAVAFRLSTTQTLLLASLGAAAGVLLAVALGWPGRTSTRRAQAAGAVVAALVASSLVVAPVTAWGIASDFRVSRRMDQRLATRIGAEQNHVDTSLTDRVAAVVPESDTYALVISNRVGAGRAGVFQSWTLSALLPRVAVMDPGSADWIVSWGVAPPRLRVPVVDVHVFRTSRDAGNPVYVARVAR